MTGAGSGPDQLNRGRPPHQMTAFAVLRAVGSTVALVAAYYLLPLDRLSGPAAAVILAAGLVALTGLVAFQADRR
jgi:hypothetical protein